MSAANEAAAVARHRAELFGTPADPDATPVDQRDPGPGRVLVEWIGESGPLADRKLAMAERLGLIPAKVARAWRELHARATTRIPGMTHHTMTRERDGMSETYTWGPYDYTVAVTHRDADTLLSGSFGHQFRIVGYAGPQPAGVPAVDRFLTPFVPAETAAKVAAIEIEEEQPQELVGEQRFTALGAWTPTR
jgi:hypothetical protein